MLKKKDETILILLLFSVQFTHILDFVIMMPLGPTFMRFFHIGPREFSYVVSSYGFAAACGGFVSSFFMDYFDRKKSLIFLYSGFIIGTLFCALAFNHHALIAARAVAGMFGGVLNGLLFSILGDSIPEERRGQRTGTVMSAFGLASVVGIPTGLFLANKYTWHTPFIFLAGISFVVLFFIIKKMNPVTAHLGGKKVSLKELLLTPNHARAYWLSLFIILSGFMVIPFVSPYMVKNVGLSESELPFLYFFGGICTFITSNYIGKLSDAHGKKKMFYIVGTLSIIPILTTTHLPRLPLSIALIANCLFFILVSGRFVPIMALIVSSVAPPQRGAFMSINSAIQSLGIGLASFVSGALITTNAHGELLHYGLVGFLSVGLTLFCLYLASRIKIVK